MAAKNDNKFRVGNVNIKAGKPRRSKKNRYGSRKKWGSR